MIRKHDKGREPAICDCGSHGFVSLTRGAVALFDVALSDAVADGNWYCSAGLPRYAVCASGKQYVAMHSMVLPARVGRVPDHINGDGLDNRSENLRYATYSQNTFNTGTRNRKKTSKYKGVSSTSDGRGWEVCCSRGAQRKRAVVKSSEEEAAHLYDAFAVQLFGNFARTNKMMGLL